MAITIPTLDEAIKRMKQEIIEDIKTGRVPADCHSFSALHDYVDANCYGGFCEENEMQALMDHFSELDKGEGMPDALIGYLNDAQNSIDLWIKDGGIQQFSQPTADVAGKAASINPFKGGLCQHVNQYDRLFLRWDLDGYPDTLRISVSDMQAYKQFGNSVVVDVMSRCKIDATNARN